MCITAAAATGALIGSAVRDTYKMNQSVKYANNQILQTVNQAKASEVQAGIERQQGIEDARHEKMKAILAMGDIKSKTAASNIALNSQTALNLLDTEKLKGDYEAEKILDNSMKTSDNYMRKAQDLYNNAQLMSLNTKRNGKDFLINSGLKIAAVHF